MTILSFIPKTSIKLFALFKYPFQRSEVKHKNTISVLKNTQRWFCSFPSNTTGYRSTTAAGNSNVALLLENSSCLEFYRWITGIHYEVAVDFVHTGCCLDQLNHGSRFTSTAELSSTENNETKYTGSPLFAEAPPGGPTPYPFIYHFGRKGTPFIYLLLKKGTPFTYLL